MTESIILLYDLYHLYIYFFSYGLSAFLLYKKMCKQLKYTIQEKAFLIPLVVLTGAIMSLIIYWLNKESIFNPTRLVLEIVGSTVLGGFSMFLWCTIIRKISIFFLTDTIKNIGYVISIFTMFFVQFVAFLPEKIPGWVEGWYATDYSMGIGSRFLIGEILSLFYDDYLDKNLVWKFCIITIIAVIAIVSYLLGKMIVNSKNKIAVIFLTGCFVACPSSLSGLWGKGNMGRLEIYTILLTLIAVCLFRLCKKQWIKYLILSITVCICNAIYQGYVFLYFPIIFIVIMSEVFDEEGISKMDMLLGLGVVICTCVSFLFFQFGTSVIYETEEQMAAAIQMKSNVNVSLEALRFELFAPISAAFSEINIAFLTGEKYPRENLLITMLLLLPLVVIGMALYLKCFNEVNKEQKKILMTPYLYCVLIHLAILPQFILNVDWGRWLIAVTLVFFFGIFYLIYIGKREMLEAVACLEKFIKKHYFLSVILLLYLSVFSPFTVDGMKNEIITFANNLARIFGMI